MSKTRTAERAQFLADVLTTAVEGGIGYWSRVTAYRWQAPDLGYSDGREGTPEVADAEVTILEVEEEGAPEHTVTLDTIAKGLGLIRAAKHDPAASEWYEGTTIPFLGESTRRAVVAADRANDAGEIDSSRADVILQVALFGKVIYG